LKIAEIFEKKTIEREKYPVEILIKFITDKAIKLMSKLSKVSNDYKVLQNQ
jgi:hypothetical protein